MPHPYITEIFQQRVLVLHLPHIFLNVSTEGRNEPRCVGILHTEKPHSFTGIIKVVRHLLRKGDHSLPGHNHHALFTGLGNGLIHQQRILTGRRDKAPQNVSMEEHIGIHDNGVVIERRPCDPQRGNTTPMKLLIDQECDTDSTGIGCHSLTNHLLLISDHDVRSPNPNRSQ